MATSDKKLVRSKSGMRMITRNEALFSPLTLTEPIWTPDAECSQCEACSSKFDFITRRHHCRRCGRCFCNTCSSTKSALPRLSFVDPVRQCAECIIVTKKEKDFFDSHLKVLETGTRFQLTSTTYSEKNEMEIDHPRIYMSVLSKDHRRICLDCVSHKHEVHDPIELLEIDSVQLLSSNGETLAATPTGMSPIAGVSIRYRDSSGEMQTVKLVAPPELEAQRQALSWAQALRIAIKLVFERRDQMKLLSSSNVG